jgi:Nitroreductase
MENTVLKALLTRRSVRNFNGKAIPEDIMTQIIAAGQQAPSSINGQQISLVVIEDKAKIAKIAELCGGQQHIAGAAAFICVVADFNRVAKGVEIAGSELGFLDTIEGLVTGSVDAGITVASLATAAESFGLGTTVIGALRGQLQGMIDLLAIPHHAVPIIGLTLGYPDPEQPSFVKPRIAPTAYAFKGEYPKAFDFASVFTEYEALSEEFRKKSGQNEIKYTEKVAAMYGKNGRKRDTAAVYEKQGFKLK